MTELIKHYGRNLKGKDYIIGDIHGCFSRVEKVLELIKFNSEVDRLFSVGDLIDRGPESERVVEWLDKPWFHAVRGNHEDFAFMSPLNDYVWLMNGGSWFMGLPSSQKEEIVSRIKEMPIAIELETVNGLVGIIHADVPKKNWKLLPEILRIDSVQEHCMWSRTRIRSGDCEAVDGILAVVVGHTPLKKLVTLGNVIHIETAGWLADESGYFTILDADTLLPVDLGFRNQF
jgi:serine/threonine protein phosphatase 1